MAVTPEQVAAHLRLREDRRREEGRRRAASLDERLGDARRILVEHGARAVWLFGSLARREATATSDVDLAVEGLPSSAYFAALAEVATALGCTPDLVRLEDAPEALRERVAAEGRPL